MKVVKGQADWLISTGKLNPSRDLHTQPIKVVVFDLPTSAILLWRKGYLVLRRAWRLYAFSAYPFRTWLPSLCPWQDNWNTSGSSLPVLSY